MLFNSWQFAVFFPCVFLLYYAIPHRVRWVFLLIASYYFYMSWDARLVWLIAAVTLVSYLTARIIGASEKKTVRRAALVGAVGFSLGLLFFYKYFNFAAGPVFAAGASRYPDPDFAGGRLLLYLPNPELCNRRIPGRFKGRAASGPVRAVCLLLSPVGGRAHRAQHQSPAPIL